ncbi:hypothetical protein RFM41_24025 [Mesorhizobium sp. VK25A]|uniref:Uncharacterized protein n=2 Tax=Mesorhizobium TaxID=68287 RepID=A0ABU5ADH8_9HYPH|nr:MULTISPECIES: hypothetical protein [unclassified Mesorhizobium]MDX8469793.1 hypothetical protein [Mesorhizobium sp. VK23B]MDX8476132.1 hypothetical protein [Mesorhizobium sp. VK23A]MDX8508385.1 hypothetical protein [Mesorhizobium sp. VK22E]MDX8535336.1 hypothetical protein [Mesorhizobium sp. VK25D]MDX8546836.1 hypothetical protein [Mesorhizobium sp. VK25A]
MTTPSPLVLSQPDQVIGRLQGLGLTEENLLHAARRWHVAWSGFTANHPPFGIGIAAWMEAVAALRETTMPLGWVRSDERNYALVISPDGAMAISVATGDAGTGRPDTSPSNKAPKGVSTADAISVNQIQLELDLPVPELPSSEDDGPLTWFLLLHRAHDEIRCELSLPLEMSPDGRISRWKERLILSSIPLDGDIVEVVAPEGPDLDIDVKRKA